MSLLFDADTEQVAVGTMGSWNPNGSPLSAYGWFYPIGTAGNASLFGKNTGSPLFKSFTFNWRRGGGQTQFNLGRAVTDVTYNYSPHPWTLNAWNFFGVSYDDGRSANNKVELYKGTSTSPPTLQTASSNADGAGAFTDFSSLAMTLGNAFDGGDEDANGRLGNVTFVDSVALTLNQFTKAWRGIRPVQTLKGWWELGFNGTGTQPDWSGNAYNGTVTGATAAAHVPLDHPFGSWRRAYSFAAAAITMDRWYLYTSRPAQKRELVTY